MRSIASLCQVDRHASLAVLQAQRAALHDALGELCQALDRVDTLIHEREQAHEYAVTATLEAREVRGIVSYADIRGS